MQTPTMKGTVYLMGAGSGDRELLTEQALRVLRTAEVVLHDESISSEILDLIPASTQVRNVHKLGVEAEHLHEKVHSLLISAAREGHQVVRLVAADPSQSSIAEGVTGALVQAGVDFEVISSAAIAVGTAAGANPR
jgi:siroheme synthase